MRTRLWTAALAALAVLVGAATTCAAPKNGVGVVFMHGGGMRPVSDKKPPPESAVWRYDSKLPAALVEQGYAVAKAAMSWGVHRDFDKPFDEAVAEIDGHVAKLRRDGASRIVIAGTSMGANATLFYAASHPEIAGAVIFAIGPGPSIAAEVEEGVAAAAAAIAKGDGDRAYFFMGTNSGVPPYRVRSTPRIYQSYYGPTGAIQWPDALKKVRADMPLLVVTATADPSATRRLNAALEELAPSPAHTHVVIEDAGHFGLSDHAVPAVMDWLTRTFAP